mmetsp:Transcript_5251/g.15144  ORF Transcript_5251/g.15144 Transcript_5251/m.15144 type:complete len:262 (-) Transcript_5251:1363-2148(-)
MWLNQVMPQSLRSMTSPAPPWAHLADNLPPKTCKATRGPSALLPSPMRASTTIEAARRMRFQSAALMALLPSTRSATSTLDLHLEMRWFFGRSQAGNWHILKFARSWLCGPGQLPVPTANSRTFRVRCCVPLPQVALQADHSVHLLNLQSWLQACALHSCASVTLPQGWPPCSAFWSTFRIRSLMPPPHSAEHSLHPLQTPTLQSTGHFSAPQFCINFSGGQPAPRTGGEITVRVSSRRPPPPQGTEQTPSAQAETWQSWK